MLSRAISESVHRLTQIGISEADAFQLRRIAMTLHRWHELECGDSNDYGSWAIETIPVTKETLYKKPDPGWCQQTGTLRIPANVECKHVEGGQGWHWAVADVSRVKGGNEHDLAHRYIWLDDSDVVERPFMVHHHYTHGRGKDYTTRTPIADREAGAKRRLARIMARYPHLTAYVQTDPRGCALYILRPDDVPAGEDASSYYSRGVAVYK